MVLQCQAVTRLAEAVAKLPPAKWEDFHHFDHGVYQRGLMLPAGTVAAGAIHRHKNMLTLVKGECLFLGGEEPVHAVAPFASIDPGGTQRAVYAITDCVLISYVETNLTTKEEVEAVAVVTKPEHLLLSMEEYHELCHLSRSGGTGLVSR